MFLLNWLRDQVKQAFIGGIHDGMAELANPHSDTAIAIKQHARAALPAPTPEPAKEEEPETAAASGKARRSR
jgi:hypothetical protein